jgi:hypothetical protein
MRFGPTFGTRGDGRRNQADPICTVLVVFRTRVRRSAGSFVSTVAPPAPSATATTIASTAEGARRAMILPRSVAAARASSSSTDWTSQVLSSRFSWKSRRWSPVRASTRTTEGTMAGHSPLRRSSSRRARFRANIVTPWESRTKVMPTAGCWMFPGSDPPRPQRPRVRCRWSDRARTPVPPGSGRALRSWPDGKARRPRPVAQAARHSGSPASLGSKDRQTW